MARHKKTTDEKYRQAFATRFRELMEREPRTSQAEIADAIGKSRQVVSQYFNGESEPTFETLVKIADFFRVSTDYLLGKPVPKSTDPSMQAAAAFTGLSEDNLDFLNQCVRVQEMRRHGNTDDDSGDSALIPDHYLKFVNEIIEIAQSNDEMMADYASLNAYDDSEAMLQLGPQLFRDIFRFKASKVGRAIEDHLSERVNYGND